MNGNHRHYGLSGLFGSLLMGVQNLRAFMGVHNGGRQKTRRYMGVQNGRPRGWLVCLFMGVLFLAGCKGSKDPVLTTVDFLPAKQGLLPSLNQADPTFEGEHFSGHGACTTCHTDQNSGDAKVMVVLEDAGERDVSIGRAWQTSMMANASRDPYWHAVFASELHKFPTISEEINDTCTRCHAPMANETLRQEGEVLQWFDSGSEENGDFVQGVSTMDSTSDLFNHAMDGTSCTVCHQLADDGNLGEDAGMSGGWTIVTYPEENKDERAAYGQYTDPDSGYMREQSEFNGKFGAHISTSETCGNCHNLKTSPVNDDGTPVEDVTHFAEQMIYTEWENSIFDTAGSQPTTCQNCHMPTLADPVPLTGGGELPRPNFAEHTFLGANTVVMDMMKNFREELGFTKDEDTDEFVISEADFDEAILRNREFLKTSATVEVENIALVLGRDEITEGGTTDGETTDGETTEGGTTEGETTEGEITASEIPQDKITMDVKITNLTGHKLPSGYHSRRVYLHVLVIDGDGQLVYENGKMRADGSILGVSEDANPESYEYHYDKIVSPTQVQVYQAINGRDKQIDGEMVGVPAHSLLSATRYLKDNRLTPAGFNKADVPADVSVEGRAADDDDFNNGLDTVTYEMAVTGSGSYTILVELRYQPLSFGSLQALFAESDKVPQIDMFRTIYDRTRLRDEVIATSVVTVQ